MKRKYIFTSSRSDTKHSRHHSAYLVEFMQSGPVIARITSIGLFPDTTEEQEATLYALSHGMGVSGKWAETKRRHHRKIRVIGKGTSA